MPAFSRSNCFEYMSRIVFELIFSDQRIEKLGRMPAEQEGGEEQAPKDQQRSPQAIVAPQTPRHFVKQFVAPLGEVKPPAAIQLVVCPRDQPMQISHRARRADCRRRPAPNRRRRRDRGPRTARFRRLPSAAGRALPSARTTLRVAASCRDECLAVRRLSSEGARGQGLGARGRRKRIRVDDRLRFRVSALSDVVEVGFDVSEMLGLSLRGWLRNEPGRHAAAGSDGFAGATLPRAGLASAAVGA